jgi:oligopeptidase B
LNSDPREDVEIFHETDNTFEIDIYKSKSKRFIFIVSGSTLTTEYRLLEADDPTGIWRVFNTRERNHEYSIEHYGDRFYVITNWEAKNFRLMETPVEQTLSRYWKQVIPHRDDVLLEDIEVFKDFLVVGERQAGLRRIRVIDQQEQTEHYIDFGEPAFSVYASVNPEFDTEFFRYGYTSLTTPFSIFDYHMKTKEKTLLKQEPVLGDFDPQNYQSERHYAIADDGMKIPISVVYRKGLLKDGNNPLLLYAYGAYGFSTDATFNSARLSLLDRGFVYAIAHVRGGQEMGRQWYEDGKLLKKKNTFTDFIDCGEYLIAEKYTNPQKLFAMGGSAGGLLIGAVVNMRPDLFQGAIAQVPWVDVVTTMLDDTVPLTTSEYDEWGNPNIKEYYDYMLSYSPYDHVERKDYPHMLVTTGLHDSEVQYWEPAKWVAKLRELKTDDHLLLLHTDMQAGHGGKSGRFESYQETAMEYAFMLSLLGIRH